MSRLFSCGGAPDAECGALLSAHIANNATIGLSSKCLLVLRPNSVLFYIVVVEVIGGDRRVLYCALYPLYYMDCCRVCHKNTFINVDVRTRDARSL